MAQYIHFEMVDMILCYGESHHNVSAGALLYQKLHPDRRHPTRQTLKQIVTRFRETGSVLQRPRTGRSRSACDEAHTTAVLAAVSANPHASNRAIAAEFAIGQSSVLHILHEHRFHPFRVHTHQALQIRDLGPRADFSNWILANVDDDPQFTLKVLWSDECQFARDGVANKHNLHYWADSNPRWQVEQQHQVNWRINVWCGIFGTNIMGPVFYDGTLTGARYRELILQGVVSNYVYNLPLLTRRPIWFQHDGAPAHYAIDSRQYRNGIFHINWIGRGGPVAWPARSPDLTPLDFFLWGHMKSLVYESPITTPMDLANRIETAYRSIPVEIMLAVHRSLIHRAQVCLAEDGRHFEHLL